jgi:hypothetical protein
MRKFVLWMLLFVTHICWSQQADPLIFREKIFDFGEVDELKGNVEHEFLFTNNSNRPIKILGVQASCGCTTPGWSQTPILQGKTGFIKASFDPKGRPGYFNKTLTITSDWDSNPIVLQIKGQVITTSDRGMNEFPVSNGNLFFRTKSFSLDKVYINKEPAQKQFPVINKGNAPIKFLSVAKPPYIQIEMPGVLEPGARGVIKVIYDGKAKNQFGFAMDNVQITTDDRGYEAKSISVFAMLEEYYPLPTPEEALRSPMLIFKEETVDLGRMDQNAAIEKMVTIRNAGKKDLQIRALQGNCACITAEMPNKLIKPGDSTMLKISFKPQSRGGTQQKAITVYSNDPRNPVQRINVVAFVTE